MTGGAQGLNTLRNDRRTNNIRETVWQSVIKESCLGGVTVMMINILTLNFQIKAIDQALDMTVDFKNRY